MTPDEFREQGHRLIDWIADYRETIGERPVMARTEPGAIKAALPATPPDRVEGFDAIFRDLDQILVPGLSHWQHPSFFGYFPANAPFSSVLGDFLSSGPGGPGALLAVEPGADRAGGGRRRLAPPARRALRRPGAVSSRTPPRPAPWSP